MPFLPAFGDSGMGRRNAKVIKQIFYFGIWVELYEIR